MSIAQNIRHYREAKSMTIEEFAQKTGISIPDCIRIEAGQHPLTSNEITTICGVLQITTDDLIAEQPEPSLTEGSVVIPLDKLQSLLGMMKD